MLGRKEKVENRLGEVEDRLWLQYQRTDRHTHWLSDLQRRVERLEKNGKSEIDVKIKALVDAAEAYAMAKAEQLDVGTISPFKMHLEDAEADVRRYVEDILGSTGR